MIKAKVDKLRV